MDWRQYAMSFWNDYQFVVNMQMAMYQMLSNLATTSNSNTPQTQQAISSAFLANHPSFRFRPMTTSQEAIIVHQRSSPSPPPTITRHKPLKRLGSKRTRLTKTSTSLAGSGSASTSSLNMPTSSINNNNSLEHPPISSPETFNAHYDDEIYGELEHRPVTREIMATYLATRRHRTVTILHAKVAQKSYGNEKRFFCPPPCVYLSGDGWHSEFDTPCRSSSSSSSSCSLHDQDHLCTMIGIGEPLYHTEHASSPSANAAQSGEMQHLPFENGKHFGAAKTLFISDSDKRKHINLNVKMMFGNQHHHHHQDVSASSTTNGRIFRENPYIGMFESRKIKVISKPSKKKQSVKNAESVCIQSGTKIALFNRLRSQNVSTRFLHVDEKNQFHASAHEWGSFYIHLVDTDETPIESNGFPVKEGFVQYGSTVKLVCSVTNQSLPYLVIRKVDKNRVLIDSDEPVSQLHKCAFEFKSGSSSAADLVYLCLATERIIGVAGKPCPNERFRVDINDSACWTIISTDKAEYTWFEARGPVSHPVTPVPVARHIAVEGGGATATIEITGENFAPCLSVWFGETESPCTEYRSTQSIVAEVPQFSSVMPNMPWVLRPISTPISLVRRDGIIYLTPLVFTYTPQPAAPRKSTPPPPPPPAILPPSSDNSSCE